MYVATRVPPPLDVVSLRDNGSPRRGRSPRSVSPTVVHLGLTSLFTDVAGEMVASVLPLLLVFHLNFSMLQFGLVDGMSQAAVAVLLIGGGLVSDRHRRHKEVAAAGYGLSAGCKLALAAVGGSWLSVTVVQLLDRAGKGLRTAPRDAMISLSSRPGGLGAAFGVHRALDTVGAVLGPVAAYLVLRQVPGDFGAVLVVSFCLSVIGLAILWLFVPPSAGRAVAAPDERREQSAAPRFRVLLQARSFRMLLAAAAVLGVATMSDAFVFLTLQRSSDLSFGIFPLLFMGTSVSYLLLAVPAGRLADRIGRAPVFVLGYVVLLVVYVNLLVQPSGRLHVVSVIALLGAFYALTEGVLMALASSLVSAEQRATGLATVTTVGSCARFAGSVAFGLLWTWQGSQFAVGVTLVAAVVAAVVALPMIVRVEGAPA